MTRCEPFNQATDKIFDLGLRGGWDARHVGGAAMRLLGAVLGGMLTAAAGAMVVAYLLLTNSHL